MKSTKHVAGALLAFAGFCAGVGLNFTAVHSASGDPNPALKIVAHDGTLAGDGTTPTPLGIANGGVSAPKLSTAAIPSAGQVLGFNGSNLAWQNAPVGRIRVMDSRAREVGVLIDTADALRNIGTLTFAITVGKNGFSGFATAFYVYHTSADCSGNGYFVDAGWSMVKDSVTIGQQLAYAADPIQVYNFNSYETITPPFDPNHKGKCNQINLPGEPAGLFTIIDLSTLNLTPPFHLEL